jgi:hypothetical protein
MMTEVLDSDFEWRDGKQFRAYKIPRVCAQRVHGASSGLRAKSLNR